LGRAFVNNELRRLAIALRPFSRREQPTMLKIQFFFVRCIRKSRRFGKFQPRTHEKVENGEKTAYISHATNSIDYYLILRQLIPMPRALPTKVRENVEFGLLFGWRSEEVAASNKVSIRTVERTKMNLNRFGASLPPELVRQGRPKILTHEAEEVSV
jgi:hypothetical protein